MRSRTGRSSLAALIPLAALLLSAAPARAQAPVTQPWPGSQAIATVDDADEFDTDVSGLEYVGTGTTTPGMMWAVDNGQGTLQRLLFGGGVWARDTADDFANGKVLRYTDGLGRADAEGVTLADDAAAGGIYVSSERDVGRASAVSRNSILRYDVGAAGTTLTATNEWNLTAAMPATPANTGAESVEWIPDTYLVASGFVDEHTGARYDPADYPNHGTGIFVVGLEADGNGYLFALDLTSNAFTRVGTFTSGLPTYADMHWDDEHQQLWVECDNGCAGRTRVMEIDTAAGATHGHFIPVADYARPTGMGNFNNEGFTITPDSYCVGGLKPVYWADDNDDAEHALREGEINCTPEAPPIGRAGWSDSSAVKGDFNGDGFGDLAVGVRENGSQGAVHIFPGSANGVTTTGSQLWSQNSAGIPGTSEDGDEFGRALAAGDYNDDGFADLAIGAPGENAGSGIVHVLFGSAGGLTAANNQQFSQSTAGVGDTPEAGDHFGATLAAGSFDSTSPPDLVVGVPDEDLAGVPDAGIVQVLPGTVNGPTGAGSQTWSQSSPGVADTPQAGDRFGSAIAAGDVGGSFDADLAIGVPEEDGNHSDTGSVHILLGSPTGLTAVGSTLWTQNSAGIGDTAEAGDGFGAALAIGSLHGASTKDLVIGVPGEDSGTVKNSGVVQTIVGTVAGPTGTGSQTFSQATTGITDSPGEGDEFGYAVAVGDFGGSSADDLAVGVPGESVSNVQGQGSVHVIPGGAGGLTATGSQRWTQNSAGVADTAEGGDRFGSSLTADDYGDTAEDDLAIGVPGESTGAATASGLVQVLPGSPTFLTATNSKAFGQNTAGVVDTAEPYDMLGISLGR